MSGRIVEGYQTNQGWCQFTEYLEASCKHVSNKGVNNWGWRKRERTNYSCLSGKERDYEHTEIGWEEDLGQLFLISFLGLFASSIDQIKFLLPVYSTKAPFSPRSTPSPTCPPQNTIQPSSVISTTLPPLEGLFLINNHEIYVFNLSPATLFVNAQAKKTPSSFSIYK